MKPIDILRFKLSFFMQQSLIQNLICGQELLCFKERHYPIQINKKQKIDWFFPILENYDSSISQPN